MTSQQQAQAARDRAVSEVDVLAPRPSLVRVAPAVSGWALSRRKRAFDVTTALLVSPIVLVLVSAASVVSLFVFRAWPLFFQERRGLGERPFRTLKIRSLDRSFPTQQGKLGLDISGQGRWSQVLRRSHLDELPQMFNVLGGSMSLVGPRPMIDPVLELLDAGDRAERAMVRPGLTGAWQVSTAGAHPLHECTELDAAYVRGSSLSADLRILWLTVLVLLRRRSPTPADVLAGLGR